MDDRIGTFLLVLFWIAIISTPFAIWKIIEILILFFKHLHWN